MAGNGKPRRKRILECPLLDAASTPRAPRVECCVFGCRSSASESLEFLPLPEEPERCREWLSLINRRDLEGNALALGAARVCTLHFPRRAPRALPELLLPTRHEFLVDDSSDLSTIELKPEPVEEIDSIEMILEPEPSGFETDAKPPDNPAQSPDHKVTEDTNSPTGVGFGWTIPTTEATGDDPKHIGETNPWESETPSANPDSSTEENNLWEPSQDTPNHSPEPSQVSLLPIKSEPQWFEFQKNASAQTDATEALYRHATFSAVEQISIPPVCRQLDDLISRSVDAQTPLELADVLTKDIKRKYGLELEEARKKLISIQKPHMEKLSFLRGCDKYLDEKIARFVKSHAYLAGKYGRKYPERFKVFALQLYLQNPKSYKFVEAFFDLPPKSSIERFKIPVSSGVNSDLMEALRVKVEQMSVTGKMCVLCFDVMCLTKNLYYDVGYNYLCGYQEIDKAVKLQAAEYAACISVRGLCSRWKQPVAFSLVAEKRQHPELKIWVHNTIAALFGIGLNVRALVTNSDDEFLDVTIEEPYFEVNGAKIYHIYDVPDLFKSARDELMRYDFHIEGTVAKWRHVVEVFDQDKAQDLRLLNITEEHVRPETTRNDVKMATQVFSSSVAAAMHFHVAARWQNNDAEDTIQFIKRMSDLFAILYSRKLADAYRGTASQKRFLKDSMDYLRRIQVKRAGKLVESKFVKGLTATIETLMSLSAELKKGNLNYILTKNLSKDFMQTDFQKIELLTESERPSPIQFSRAFRRLYLSNILNHTKKTATGDDMMLTLFKISEYVNGELEREKTADQSICLSIGLTDYRFQSPSSEYISGYLLWKCLEQHDCQTLVKNLCEYYQMEPHSKSELLQTFQFYNAGNIKRICKVRPPTKLRQFVDYLEVKYKEYYNSPEVRSLGFGGGLYAIMRPYSFDVPCPCFPLRYLIRVYIRLKIFSSVKEHKQNIKYLISFLSIYSSL